MDEDNKRKEQDDPTPLTDEELEKFQKKQDGCIKVVLKP